jgi:hypothetical protein
MLFKKLMGRFIHSNLPSNSDLKGNHSISNSNSVLLNESTCHSSLPVFPIFSINNQVNANDTANNTDTTSLLQTSNSKSQECLLPQSDDILEGEHQRLDLNTLRQSQVGRLSLSSDSLTPQSSISNFQTDSETVSYHYEAQTNYNRDHVNV